MSSSVVEGVLHVIGYRSNEVLLREYRVSIEILESAWHWFDHYDSNISSIKYFQDIDYVARSWRKSRRVFAKVERNGIGPNQGFIVMNLPGDDERLYSAVYCERGTMGNRHKELQMGLFDDLTSCSAWWSYQFRVMFSSLAYVYYGRPSDKSVWWAPRWPQPKYGPRAPVSEKHRCRGAQKHASN